MDREKELITLLQIEDQEWEKEILRKWIERDGMDVVYMECKQIKAKLKKRGKRLQSLD